MRHCFITCIIMLIITGGSSNWVLAHELPAATAFLDVSAPDTPILQVEVDLLDLGQILSIDADADNVITFAEYAAKKEFIAAYVRAHLSLAYGGNDCQLLPLSQSSGVRPGTAPRSVATFEVGCAIELGASQLVVDNSLLAAIDPGYRTLLTIEGVAAPQTEVLRQGTNVVLDGGLTAKVPRFFYEGIHHILIGIDHLAFLLLLIIPLARDGTKRNRFLRIAGVVTAFTVAHSITLLLATRGALSLNAQMVEVSIAASIVVAGLLNFTVAAQKLSWMLAYGFGLIHGFGFAGALKELLGEAGITMTNLLSFNLGVEVGQLAVVAVALPLLSVLGSNRYYKRLVVPTLSAGIALLGSWWLVARI